jgi:hypothetical protein
MPSLDPLDPTAPESAPLRVVYPASIDLARTACALADLDWLGSAPNPPDADGTRAIETDLELPIGDRRARRSIRKSAVVEVGTPRTSDESVIVDIAWRSATFAPLFPVFVGRLAITGRSVTLDGRYAPPLGGIGQLLDRGLLHFVARRSAETLLSRFVAELS